MIEINSFVVSAMVGFTGGTGVGFLIGLPHPWALGMVIGALFATVHRISKEMS